MVTVIFLKIVLDVDFSLPVLVLVYKTSVDGHDRQTIVATNDTWQSLFGLLRRDLAQIFQVLSGMCWISQMRLGWVGLGLTPVEIRHLLPSRIPSLPLSSSTDHQMWEAELSLEPQFQPATLKDTHRCYHKLRIGHRRRWAP